MSTTLQTTVSKATLTSYLRLFKSDTMSVETANGMVLLTSAKDENAIGLRYATLCIGDHEGADVKFYVDDVALTKYVRAAKPSDAIAFSIDEESNALVANCDTVGEMKFSAVGATKPTAMEVFDNLGDFIQAITADDVKSASMFLDRTDSTATRFALSCVMFDGNAAISCDGRRLAKMTTGETYVGQTMVQSSVVEYANKFGFDVEVFADRIIAGDLIVTKTVGRYPNWQQIIPSNTAVGAAWDCDAIRKQCDSHLARCKAEDNCEYGVEFAVGGGQIAKLDARYIKAAMGKLKSVTVSFAEDKMGTYKDKLVSVPVVLESSELPGWIEVIMPMARD